MDTKPIAKPIAGADEHIKFLLEEVWSLDSKWHLYQALFVDSASIVESNRRTGFVFHFFQRTLWNDIILQIGKLLDNASYTKSKLTRWNVCFATMLRHVPAAELDAMTKEVDDFRAVCEPLLLMRNRVGAHHDEAVVLRAEVFPRVSGEKLAAAVQGVKGLMNKFVTAIQTSEIGFIDGSEEKQCAAILTRLLQEGNAIVDAERAERTERRKAMYGGDHEAFDDPLNKDLDA